MKKAIVFLILFAACKQSETTNSTSTVTVTETSATVATVAPTTTTAPTTTAPSTPAPAPAPAPAPVTTTTAAPAKTATHATTTTVAPAPAPVNVPVPVPEPPVTTTTAAAPAATPPLLTDEGRNVFASHGCAVCHGATAAGDTPMAKAKNIPDFRSSAVQSKSDADLVTVMRDAPQHKSKALTADQAKAVVAWIRSLK